MFDNMKIKNKLPFVIITFALISAIITGGISFKYSADQLTSSAEGKLTALLESRKESLTHYFEIISKDIVFQSRSPTVREAMASFGEGWKLIDSDPKRALQALYISDNPFDVGQKESLTHSDDGSIYSKYHSDFHGYFRNLAATHGYYDIFLVNQKGDIVYSVKKENDYATNLLRGEWKDSHIAEAFIQINKNPSVGSLYLTDYFNYGPSNNEPEAFLATPIHIKGEEYIGVLIFQMPIAALNSVMHVTAGMGETGETFLVGSDRLMRSDSRFLGSKSILKTRVDTDSVDKALKGISGIHTEMDYRDEEVLSAFAPFKYMSLNWAIIAEVERAEILLGLYELTAILLTAMLIGSVGILLVGYYIASDIATPISNMTTIMNRLADNDLDINISVSQRKDEVGCMAKALEVFKSNAIERDKLQKKLTHMAHHDMLTGLPTRKLIMDRLQDITAESGKESRTFAVMFADLDNFKTVNDTLGHHIGDEVIKTAARIFKESLKEEDFVARIGGDEFIILVTDVADADAALIVANKLVVAIKTGLSVVCATIPVTLSLGVAIYPEDAGDVTSLIRHADEAMYRAKEASKNRCSR
ncbi:GGDEF domain-containing protein [Veronia nyctiphanis]|uniref:GGDEF domain-containing protein n=1 Tax=Veronia nyctiphanis TaxID=1278244 RepID=A0A4V1LSF4_9GAMM|nr:GGDEF domain-containing protein [Veronia nyctiphanis]RXJ71508.1 GGDEF domain-containing protein [Veronia nyctiphanis]